MGTTSAGIVSYAVFRTAWGIVMADAAAFQIGVAFFSIPERLIVTRFTARCENR
jgi:hypothetical protein